VWVTSPNHTRVDTVSAIVEEVEQGRAELDGIAIEKPLAPDRRRGPRNRRPGRWGYNLNEAYLENQVHMPGVERMKELLWDTAEGLGARTSRAQPKNTQDHTRRGSGTVRNRAEAS